jgi:hypothetical protein
MGWGRMESKVGSGRLQDRLRIRAPARHLDAMEGVGGRSSHRLWIRSAFLCSIDLQLYVRIMVGFNHKPGVRLGGATRREKTRWALSPLLSHEHNAVNHAMRMQHWQVHAQSGALHAPTIQGPPQALFRLAFHHGPRMLLLFLIQGGASRGDQG